MNSMVKRKKLKRLPNYYLLPIRTNFFNLTSEWLKHRIRIINNCFERLKTSRKKHHCINIDKCKNDKIKDSKSTRSNLKCMTIFSV